MSQYNLTLHEDKLVQLKSISNFLFEYQRKQYQEKKPDSETGGISNFTQLHR